MGKKIAKLALLSVAALSFSAYTSVIAFADTTDSSTVSAISTTSSTSAVNTSTDSTSSTSSTTGSTIPTPSNSTEDWSNGVKAGELVQSGVTSELWNAGQFTMQGLNHDPSSNLLPIAGQAPNGYTGDIIIDVVGSGTSTNGVPNDWSYTLQAVNGAFSGTVVIPYYGTSKVFVGLPSVAANLTLQSGYAYLSVQNQQPSLSDTQMGLLQSWAVNYNESTDIQQLAQQITAGHSGTYATIQAVSDWVSAHVAYNWSELRRNHVTWQQATDVLRTKQGVCQDESFLTAAMLRSVGVPTQVIAGEGMAGGSKESHEWVKAYDGTRWITFDPTWDQVYSDRKKVALPVSVNHTYFDAPTFNKSHLQQAVDCW